jgi:hypothetical protein
MGPGPLSLREELELIDRGKQSGPARSGERWNGSLRQSRLLRYRRVCQFVGAPLLSPERAGQAPLWEAPGDFEAVLERFLQDV